MTTEQALIYLGAILACLKLGYELALVRVKSRASAAEADNKRETDTSNALVVLATAMSQLINRIQDNSDVTRALTEQIAKNNENRTALHMKEIEASNEAQKSLRLGIDSNTQTVHEMAALVGEVNKVVISQTQSLPAAISESLEKAAGKTREVITDHIDKGIAPVTGTLQEVMVALAKALEMIAKAIEEIKAVGGAVNDQSALVKHVQKLLEDTQAEIKSEMHTPETPPAALETPKDGQGA